LITRAIFAAPRRFAASVGLLIKTKKIQLYSIFVALLPPQVAYFKAFRLPLRQRFDALWILIALCIKKGATNSNECTFLVCFARVS